MVKKSDEPKILLDADVVRHFIKGSAQFNLPVIYPKRLAITNIVKEELCRSPQIILPVNNFIAFSKIEEININNCTNEVKIEYARLRKDLGLGMGESSCLAIARYEKKYIASSNLRDIKDYCEKNKITYLTTLDILYDAMKGGFMSEKDCDNFIQAVKQKNSILPINKMSEYLHFKAKK